jgi:putative CocE/NonD family hydrolase
MRRFWMGVALGLVGLLAVIAGGAWFLRFEIMRVQEGLPAYSHDAGDVFEEQVEMRDGARLNTRVALPAGDGPWPTILIRNPYEGFGIVLHQWCGRFVRYGYGCVIQDVRGRSTSAGEFSPLENEGRDGRDALDWLVDQTWQDGNLGLYGPSYLAGVQWAAASEGLPDEVKTFVPTVYATDLYPVVYEGGMFRHETFTAWMMTMAVASMTDADGSKYADVVRHRPQIESDRIGVGRDVSWYRDWLSSPLVSQELWQREAFRRLVATPAETRIPVLMIGGWYDVFLGPQLGDYARLASRERSHLVIGPWTHIGEPGEAFATPAASGGLNQWKLTLDWFGHHLKGEPLEQGTGVATYILGEDRWAERTGWPPATEPTRLHLTDAAAAAGCGGGGLAPSAPAAQETISYTYDPEDPVPTRGGAGMLAFILPGFGGAPPANVWQGDLCSRADIVGFESAPLEAPLHLAGAIRVGLTVSSDAPDTAFSAKLVEVFPDGRAVNIRDGIRALSHREGDDARVPYTPGDSVGLEIAFWPIEWKVAAGSRLRLDVSSSDFPKFHAHPNRKGPWAEVTASVPARQTLHLGPGAPGWLELPVLVRR